MKKQSSLLTYTLPTFLLMLLLHVGIYSAIPVSAQTNFGTKWTCDLSKAQTNQNCLSVSADPTGQKSSPVLADINNDGILDIVVATNQGRIIAIRDNGGSGNVLFNVDVAPYFGLPAGSHHIESSPAVADIDEDGRLEIVVSVGSSATDTTTCKPGGIIVLEHTGAVKTGWPRLAADNDIPPAGCPDPIFGTPALGDLDKDGDMEIVVGGFDKRVMVWHHNGQGQSGFPISSFLLQRFPGWADNLYGKLADTIWSSPALADMNGDGYLDIIIGTDEGNFDNSWPSPVGWTCPYAPVFTSGYCGGSLYVIDRFGNLLPGFPKHILETIQSTPALADVNHDGTAEIFVGTGSYYNLYSSDHPTYGFRLFGWNSTGNDIAGWSGGKPTTGTMPASPAIGDIDGDGDPEIIALSMDKKLHAWHHTGATVSGFENMTPRHYTPGADIPMEFNVGISPVLADRDGDGDMEIFVNVQWSTVVIDGNGQQLTSTSTTGKYFTNGTVLNTPAVGDIDGDGKLELVVQNGTLSVWNLDQSGTADWPMFKQNAERTSIGLTPATQVTPDTLTFMVLDNNATIQAPVTITNLTPTLGNISWTMTKPANISVNTTSSVVSQQQTITVSIPTNTLSPGYNDLGDITITFSSDAGPVTGSPTTIPITVYVVDEIHQVYLPIITK